MKFPEPSQGNLPFVQIHPKQFVTILLTCQAEADQMVENFNSAYEKPPFLGFSGKFIYVSFLHSFGQTPIFPLFSPEIGVSPLQGYPAGMIDFHV
ncbi:hypothetical protein AAFN47_12320 [Hoeflea sp. CAU 1731]